MNIFYEQPPNIHVNYSVPKQLSKSHVEVKELKLDMENVLDLRRSL